MRILDRYVLRQFLRIFAICILGVPLLFIVIDLTDSLDRYLARGATQSEVALYYVYQFPYQALLGFPIAALLASVFTVSSMTRHFETTAAKANGISFYRLTAPLLIAAVVLSLVALALTEVVPASNRKAEQVLGREETRSETLRTSFVYRGREGRVYKVRRLDARDGRMTGIQVDREGTGHGYPTYNVAADSAVWVDEAGRWVLYDGWVRLFPERGVEQGFRFAELWDRPFTERPDELLADPKDPDEMGYAELGRFIEAVQRSGGTARELIVERHLKISFPFAVFIIVLFGTPLAHSNRRGGAPFSVGVALATTVVFLILIRISQAMGAGGVVPPQLAAWIPNLLFLGAGVALMRGVRT